MTRRPFRKASNVPKPDAPTGSESSMELHSSHQLPFTRAVGVLRRPRKSSSASHPTAERSNSASKPRLTRTKPVMITMSRRPRWLYSYLAGAYFVGSCLYSFVITVPAGVPRTPVVITDLICVTVTCPTHVLCHQSWSSRRLAGSFVSQSGDFGRRLDVPGQQAAAVQPDHPALIARTSAARSSSGTVGSSPGFFTGRLRR
jgi:hypothetical protein